jgi:hypothetical protein
VLVLESSQAPDAAADDHAKPAAIDFVEVNTAVVLGHFRRGHREVGITVGPPNVLRVLEIILRVEVAHLARDPAIVGRGIERLNSPDAADAVLQVTPKRVHVVADGSDDTHPGNDNSAIVAHE